jgi:dTDP-4-amino-4,6-dideoxygalactose transaminase
MHEITKLSKRYSITVIEDAACAMGSKIGEKMAGAFGAAACFSFHPRKLITTGEGGMIVTQDGGIAKRLRVLRDHGANMTDHDRHLKGFGDLPDFNQLGYNYRMTDIQGALGTSQMAKIRSIMEQRTTLAETYNEMLNSLSWLVPPNSPGGTRHTYQSYVCRLEIDDKDPQRVGQVRNSLMSHLDKAGVSSRPGTHAVHLLGYYSRKYRLSPEDYPNARMAHHNSITLPLFPGMTQEEQQYVVETLFKFEPCQSHH